MSSICSTCLLNHQLELPHMIPSFRTEAVAVEVVEVVMVVVEVVVVVSVVVLVV